MFPNQIYNTLRGMTQACMTRHRMYAYERFKVTWVYVGLMMRKCISGHSGECQEKNFIEVLDKVGYEWYSTVVLPIRGCVRRFVGMTLLSSSSVWVWPRGFLIGYAWGRYSYRVHEKNLARSLRDNIVDNVVP